MPERGSKAVEILSHGMKFGEKYIYFILKDLCPSLDSSRPQLYSLNWNNSADLANPPDSRVARLCDLLQYS